MSIGIARAVVVSSAPAEESMALPGFDDVYRDHFDDCCRWLRAMGAPEAELDDLAQETFLVVRRRLAEGPVANLRGWLYGIARNVLANHRRSSWWRNAFSRRGPAVDPPAPALGPAERLEERESARITTSLLDRLSPRHRAVLVLFEVEGYSGQEIAGLEGIPVKTVWTRLHHARKAFVNLAEGQRLRRGGQGWESE